MNIVEHKDITYLSNYKTPAQTRYFLHIQNRQDIDKIFDSLTWVTQKGLPYILITGGTNSLFAFDVFPGLVIHIDLKGWSYDAQTKILRCSAGDKIWDIAESLESDYGQNIWHRFIGLPGSVAGAVYGNAGCFGLETSGNFKEIEVINIHTGVRETIQKSQMNFSYRSSLLKEQKKFIILYITFDLSEVVEKYKSDVDNIYFREHMQPKGNSCGSFFKNPSIERGIFLEKYPELASICPKQVSAGFLIEQVGLKGIKKSGAYFSDLHANFLMHDGYGNHKDLLNLLHEAQYRVKDRFDIYLENEVQIIYPS